MMKASLSKTAVPARPGAFSVLELLVAVSILAIMIVGMLAMFYQTQRAFRGGLAQTDVNEGGRTIMQMIARELQEAAATEVPFTTNLIAAVTARPAVSSTMQLLGGAARNNALQDITFISRINDEWFATAYRISNAVDGAGALYRWTGEYPTNFTVLSNLSYFAVTKPGPNPAVPATLDPNFQFLADGIAHFAVRVFDANGYPPTNMVVLPGGFAFTNQLLPAYVDLELGVLEPKAMEKLRARPDAPSRLQFLQTQAGRTHLFKQRIPIRNAP